MLETDRLVLKKLTLDDAPYIQQLLNEPSFLAHIGDKGVRDKESACAYLESGPIASYRQHGFGLNLCTLKDDTAIGMCGLLKRDTLEDVDLGFAFSPAYWGKGYATEAALASLNYGHQVLGLTRIVAITNLENEASANVLLRIGMAFEGYIRLKGEEQDVSLYACHRIAG